MKHLLFFLICYICIASVFTFAQESKLILTDVTSATVFSDRAMVTREGATRVQAGNYQFVLSNLPSELLDESVRVSGKGTAAVKILDVKVETEFTAEIQEKAIKQYQKTLDSLQQIDQLHSDNIVILESQKEFVESLKVESARDINKSMTISKPTAKDWQGVLGFLKQNLESLYADLRAEKLQRNALALEMKAIKRKIDRTTSQGDRSFKRIIVTAMVQQSGVVKLESSYLVNDASWYPVYDARVSPDSKELEFTYYGLVRQSTGEDWNDIKLTLSTAQPIDAQSLPELMPLYLDRELSPARLYRSRPAKKSLSSSVQYEYRADPGGAGRKGSVSGRIFDRDSGEALPGVNVVLDNTIMGASTDADGSFQIKGVPAGRYQLNVSFIGYQGFYTEVVVKKKKNLYMNLWMEEAAVEGENVIIVASRPLVQEKDVTYSLAGVQEQMFSSIFELPTANTIPSDDETHKVTIAIESLDVKFEYMAVPKLVEKIFVRGIIVNQTDYPFLPGEVNTFIGNEFVSKSALHNVVVNDTFELALGIDEGIKVERKLINRVSGEKGFLSGRKKVTYEFEIIVTNTKSSSEVIDLVDQLPISQNEKVKIELIEPDKKEVMIDNQNRLTWKLRLKAGELKKLKLMYRIESPAYSQITGLE